MTYPIFIETGFIELFETYDLCETCHLFFPVIYTFYPKNKCVECFCQSKVLNTLMCKF